MFCQYCGCELPNDAKFCNACGKPLESSAVAKGTQFAGFWVRFTAAMIDIVILLIPCLLVSFLLRASFRHGNPLVDFANPIMSTAIWWAYSAVLQSSKWQATLGKKILGLKVCDYQGVRISFARASGRFFASYLSALLVGIGFIMVAFTRNKQGLHDFMAKTLVVRSL